MKIKIKIKTFLSKTTHLKYFREVTLAFILILGFVLRLYKINSPLADWHSFRQADTAAVSRIYMNDGINLLYPRYYDVSSTQSRRPNPNGYRFVEFPIYNAVHAFLAKSFTVINFEVWGRLITIFSALISAFVLYLLGERYIGRYGGLLAAFFMSQFLSIYILRE